jgi:hypothetical protein
MNISATRSATPNLLETRQPPIKKGDVAPKVYILNEISLFFTKNKC